jgi:hypothetical protein
MYGVRHAHTDASVCGGVAHSGQRRGRGGEGGGTVLMPHRLMTKQQRFLRRPSHVARSSSTHALRRRFIIRNFLELCDFAVNWAWSLSRRSCFCEWLSPNPPHQLHFGQKIFYGRSWSILNAAVSPCTLQAAPCTGLVARAKTPSLACNHHIPCPTQRTLAAGLWVSQQHGAHSQRKIPSKSREKVTSPKEL